jgi:hypothetical protein
MSSFMKQHSIVIIDLESGAYATQVYSLCASMTAVYLLFFVFGRVLTRLDCLD